MSLRAVIAEADRLSDLLGNPALPREAKLAAVARRAERRWGEAGSTRPPPERLAALAARYRDPADLDALTAAERSDLPWLIWAADPLDEARRDRFLDWLERHGPRQAWRALVHAYLEDFRPERPALHRIAGLLADKAEQFRWSWSARQRRFRLFDSERAPAIVARQALETGPNVQTILDEAGLGGALGQGGFGEAAFRAALAIVSTELPATDRLSRLLHWSTGEAGLRYPASRAALADGLLSPFAQIEAPDDLRRALTEFLTIQIGDPRTAPARWRDMAAEARRILSAWLVLDALEQFAPIVEALSHENQWGYRRAFWRAFLKRGHIDEAWLAYAEPAAERLAPRGPRHGILVEGEGVEANHVVLLLRIGSVVVADWSHNGRCYLWGDAGSAPRLSQGHYSAATLSQGADGKIVHARGDYGQWQRSVASFINEATGRVVVDRDYMPMGWR